MFNKIILTIAIVSSLTAFAHEGHDDAPGALKANHGGTVKAGKELNLEYVVTGSEVKLFPVSHDGKDVPASDVKVTATTKAPKGKLEAAKIESKDGVYVTQVDFKGAYRLEMAVTADFKGKKSEFKFQVEK
ncbi:MAG: FixH family protein [Bdellovibrio sp.]|nr:FixH family protein [Bdellovibrio sp.]